MQEDWVVEAQIEVRMTIKSKADANLSEANAV
jgi:hypothetical protein